jgi:hypothetical protein
MNKQSKHIEVLFRSRQHPPIIYAKIASSCVYVSISSPFMYENAKNFFLITKGKYTDFSVYFQVMYILYITSNYVGQQGSKTNAFLSFSCLFLHVATNVFLFNSTSSFTYVSIGQCPESWLNLKAAVSSFRQYLTTIWMLWFMVPWYVIQSRDWVGTTPWCFLVLTYFKGETVTKISILEIPLFKVSSRKLWICNEVPSVWRG